VCDWGRVGGRRDPWARDIRGGDPWACDFDKRCGDFWVLCVRDRAGCHQWDRICRGGVTMGTNGIVGIEGIVDGAGRWISTWYVA